MNDHDMHTDDMNDDSDTNDRAGNGGALSADGTAETSAPTAPEVLPPHFRFGALIFGVAFIVVGLAAVSLDPTGFDANAILLWPVTMVVIGLACVAALIGAIARRFQT